MNKFIKSPLNYTGGKHKLLPQLIPLFPKDNLRFFVDMFAGGCNVAANITNAKTVIANDFDEKVIGIYRRFKEMDINSILKYVNGKIAEYGLTMQNQEGYNKFREHYNKGDRDPLDLFILICFSFNHQIRFNKNGEFNMPFGKDRSCFNAKIKQNLVDFRKALDRIILTSKSFDEVKIDKLGSNDFVYCDPPYLITCATYNEQDGWNETCERNLLELLDKLNEKGVRFALSNVFVNKGRTNDILIKWSEKYNVYHLSNTYSNCSYHAKDRDKTGTDEVLVTNY